MTKKLFGVFLCALLLVCGTSCGRSEKKADSGRAVSYYLAAQPETLDPQVAGGEGAFTMISCLYEGLCRLDAQGKAIPGVAESWESADGGRSFTFHLRKDAVWAASGGKSPPVTAQDFVFAFRRALAPGTGSKTSDSMLCLKNAAQVRGGTTLPQDIGVTAKDEYTLVVNLAYPVENFPALTAQAVFMPCNEEFFNSVAGRYGMERVSLLSNGPYVIDGKYGWDAGKTMSLRRSSRYKGEKEPVPEGVKFTFGKEADVSNVVAALQTGVTDAAAMPAGRVEDARAAGCAITSFEDCTWGLCFNTSSGLFTNADARKAFVQSLDRAALIQHLPVGCGAAQDIVPHLATLNGSSYRAAAGTGFYAKSSGEAPALLAQGLAALSLEECPTVKVICPDDPAAQKMVEQMLAAWNGAFKQYFNMQPMPQKELNAAVAAGRYELAVLPLHAAGDGPSALLGMFRTGAAGNPAKLASAEYDALLANAEASGGDAAVKAFAGAERWLCEEAVFYPLWYESRYYAAAPGVQNLVFRPYGAGVDFFSAKK